MPVVGLATALFLVTSLNSAPSVPSVPAALPEMPPAEEVAAIEELASWLSGADEGGGLQAMSASDLRAAIREKPRVFELFRRYNDKEARRELLLELPYGNDIFETAQRYELDSLLVAAVVETESNFSPRAVSPQGAVGLMQVLPSTGSSLGARNLYDPKVNLDVGSRYFSGLLDQFDGDVELALAAYNAGPGNVDRYGGIPPFGETRGYINKVMSRYVEHHRQIWDSNGSRELFRLY
jgi:soluble lytic murein transglycosylase-like protein